MAGVEYFADFRPGNGYAPVPEPDAACVYPQHDASAAAGPPGVEADTRPERDRRRAGQLPVRYRVPGQKENPQPENLLLIPQSTDLSLLD